MTEAAACFMTVKAAAIFISETWQVLRLFREIPHEQVLQNTRTLPTALVTMTPLI